MEEHKDVFYVVRKGDVVGIYTSFKNCQNQAGSSVFNPPVSVFKGYGLPKEAEEYLVSHGLKNASYTISASDVKDGLFGSLVACPYQQPASSMVNSGFKVAPYQLTGRRMPDVVTSGVNHPPQKRSLEEGIMGTQKSTGTENRSLPIPRRPRVGTENVNSLPRKVPPLPRRVDGVGDIFKARQYEIGSSSKAEVDRKARLRVKKALSQFQEQLTRLSDPDLKRRDIAAAANSYMRTKYTCGNTKKQIGHIPGVEVGDKFRCRSELMIVGLHSQSQCGIDYMTEDGNLIATSVVDSGRYANMTVSHDKLIYKGQGGNPKVSKAVVEDQKPEGGNLALMNSKAARTPVRVIRSYKFGKESGYVYDGLYTVDFYEQKIGEFGYLVYEFTLRRISDQPKLTFRNSLDGALPR